MNDKPGLDENFRHEPIAENIVLYIQHEVSNAVGVTGTPVAGPLLLVIALITVAGGWLLGRMFS